MSDIELSSFTSKPYNPYRTPYNSYADSYLNQQDSQTPQPVLQQQIQMTIQDKDTIQELLYYINNAYQRVIEACIEIKQTQKMKEEATKTAIFKLNILIDNSNIQFNAASKRFPKDHLNVFTDTLRNMEKDFENFVKNVPIKNFGKETLEQLIHSFKRFQTVLKLEPLTLTPITKKETDPSLLRDSISAYYGEISKAEKDIAAVKKTKKISSDKPNSQWKRGSKYVMKK